MEEYIELSDNQKRYIKEREVRLARAKKYKDENRDEINRKKREAYHRDRENPEFVEKERKRFRDFYSDHKESESKRKRECNEKTKERQREYGREYRRVNPDKSTAGVNRRRAKRRNNGIFKVTDKDIIRMRNKQRGVCAYCGKKFDKLELDHIVPLDKGGRHSLGNLILCCRICNTRKSNLPLILFKKRYNLL